METSLAPSFLRASVEFLVNSGCSLAFGILINIDDPRATGTITSVVILACYLVNEGINLSFDVKDAWLPVTAGEYERVLLEVRKRKGDRGACDNSPDANTPVLPIADPGSGKKEALMHGETTEKR
jgi:hypothetical protein